jgi:mannitol operon transcriptional activator
LLLLTASEPLILIQLQQLVQISRATTLKDLDEIEAWLVGWGMALLRKPNFGIQVEAIELVRQQALAALVWGETPFGESLTAMSYIDGLEFSLKTDAGLLPLVRRANQILSGWSTTRVTGQVA